MKISKKDALTWFRFLADLPEEELPGPRQQEIALAVTGVGPVRAVGGDGMVCHGENSFPLPASRPLFRPVPDPRGGLLSGRFYHVSRRVSIPRRTGPPGDGTGMFDLRKRR